MPLRYGVQGVLQVQERQGRWKHFISIFIGERKEVRRRLLTLIDWAVGPSALRKVHLVGRDEGDAENAGSCDLVRSKDNVPSRASGKLDERCITKSA